MRVRENIRSIRRYLWLNQTLGKAEDLLAIKTIKRFFSGSSNSLVYTVYNAWYFFYIPSE